jgi:hypothetical protein
MITTRRADLDRSLTKMLLVFLKKYALCLPAVLHGSEVCKFDTRLNSVVVSGSVIRSFLIFGCLGEVRA